MADPGQTEKAKQEAKIEAEDLAEKKMKGELKADHKKLDGTFHKILDQAMEKNKENPAVLAELKKIEKEYKKKDEEYKFVIRFSMNHSGVYAARNHEQKEILGKLNKFIQAAELNPSVKTPEKSTSVSKETHAKPDPDYRQQRKQLEKMADAEMKHVDEELAGLNKQLKSSATDAETRKEVQHLNDDIKTLKQYRASLMCVMMLEALNSPWIVVKSY